MKRPYVVAHVLSSIDGRIQIHNWPPLNTSRIFESTAETFKSDAWIVGRTTMQEFSSKEPHRLGRPDPSIPKEDFIGSHSTKTYAVAIDPSGKCRWDSNMVSTEHVIEVLTETVSTAYLKHLRDRQVSYIFAGKTSINLKVALAKLRKLFGITKVRIDGGGVVWGSFLKASLIDEISHIVVPVADGSIGTPTVFDAEQGHTKRKAKALRLKSIKRFPGGVLWMLYRVKK
ncbi:MAG TPA: dihydrofolate reductase family protein [Chthoniobacterales bacterium]